MSDIKPQGLCPLCGAVGWREAQPAPVPVAWPRTAAEVRDFIGSNFNSRKDEFPAAEGSGTWEGTASENDVYCLTVHDLLSAFDQWQEAQPAPAPTGTAPEAPTCGRELCASLGYCFEGRVGCAALRAQGDKP